MSPDRTGAWKLWPADRAATQVLLQPRAINANGLGRAPAPE
jgi:hypothetical protein